MELFDTKLLHANDLFNGVYAVLYFFAEGLCHALAAFTVRFRLAEQKEEYVIAVGVNFGGLDFVFVCGEIFVCKQALLIGGELLFDFVRFAFFDFYGDERIRVGLLRGGFGVDLFLKRIVHAEL